MDEVDRLKNIIQDQTRMLQEKNRLLSEMEYRLKKNIVSGSRKEDLAKYQFQLNKDTIEGQGSLLKTILGSIPFGLIVVNTKKEIISYNGVAQDLLNISDKEALGKPCSDVFGTSCKTNCLLDDTMKIGVDQRRRRISVRTGKNKEIVLSLNVAPIRNGDGKVIGGVEVFYDITKDVYRENLLLEKQDSLVRVLSRVMEKKDDYILSHSERVKDLALRLGEKIGFSSPKEMQEITNASLLHDIGLLSVPDVVFNSKDSEPESDKAFDLIRAHPVDGELMLSSVEGFSEIKKIVRSHHERYDGKGYPDGLSGTQIPLVSRVIALVEAYDAMLNDRASKRRATEEILEEIQENRGSQFDPDLVDVFIKDVVGNAT